ncbi:MAG: HNH endonuclease [Geobacter sp.]|nr:HNH endonuclease [Geobacter sp.]
MPKTKHDDIVDYWSEHQDECGLSVDWAEAHERCWRCGYKSKLERCHIIPDSMAGPDEPSNLVLLCHRCHREAPNVKDPRFMWIWIRAYGTSFYDTFWTLRGMEEFEKMFKRKPFAEFEARNISQEVIRAAMFEAMQSATIHFGEGRMNPSTIACVLYQVEEKLLK